MTINEETILTKINPDPFGLDDAIRVVSRISPIHGIDVKLTITDGAAESTTTIYIDDSASIKRLIRALQMSDYQSEIRCDVCEGEMTFGPPSMNPTCDYEWYCKDCGHPIFVHDTNPPDSE